ncbi:ubiquitin carboxyl-terminal hydrolase 48-like isoform X1 [Sorex fumeus]|uniref:ubiquitin carboxyl-terminal hydrolase 48-like isoform X1 n=1 Tax=Sorex fumeus TaxID=62283 RepID=UPI0024ADC92B|nr:ubiquitin carboxyl-terminal hydrolase 48-like isoform X1 [Sorex fumeus]
MAPKLQLEKAAWRWVEKIMPENVSQEHVEAAYRIWLEPCIRGICKRNCKGNPNCFVGIGEHIWLGEINENRFHKVDDPEIRRRKENSFVGLTNLGATCYVNTFLQVWFLNLEFRQALYLYPSSYSDYKMGNRIQEGKDYEPQTVCEHLQYLFALLQNSNKRYIDPSGLVKALGLDTEQQQDAQEFSKLFMSLLEDTLSKQKNPRLSNIVQQQFCGEYAYVTVCNHCGKGSELASKFYELQLNIEGHKLLTDSISDFLKEEKLEGDNRYFCENCQSKQNATRKIRLLSLPCTLNLQLMCFVFDRKTGYKKKLNTYIGFSESLDMNPYIEQKGRSYMYELSAVLIHRGSSAYSGHYIAHVKDPKSGEWYKFNDENIEKLEGSKLELGIENDIPVSSRFRKPKCDKGTHCSRNAYMLVYRLQTQEKPMTTVPLPDFLKELVDEDNSKFDKWCAEMTEKRKQNVCKGKAKHEEFKELYPKLVVGTKNEPYEFVSLAWLKTWLSGSKTTPPIDNNAYLCPHDKLHPDKMLIMKRISSHAADVFYSRYGGGPRLTAESLCKECVVDRCRKMHQNSKLNVDYKIITNMLKETVLDNQGFWVGKFSLRNWRQLALEQIGEQDLDQNNGKMSNYMSKTQESKEERERVKFNEDIVCLHGDLVITENERRLVSQEIWSKLQYYFPKAPEFSSDKESCPQCKSIEKEGEENNALYKELANEQKSSLMLLFKDKSRPYLSYWPENTDVLYIVPQIFVEEWRKFIRKPTRCSPVSSIVNSALLCPHGGLMYTIDSMAEEDAKHVTVIWPSEWEMLQKFFAVDHAIKIIRMITEKENDIETHYISEPNVCLECREGLLCQKQRDLFEYTQATIYILKVVDDKKVTRSSVPVKYDSGFQTQDRDDTVHDDGVKDPDYEDSSGGTKRQRLLYNSQCYVNDPKQVRRSTRRKKARGEKALLVSATNTLKDLKIQIMHAFSIAPFDQNLSYEGKPLSDDQATLGTLGIIPESIILLKSDEPTLGYFEIDTLPVHSPEEGFKGTCLLKH